MKAFLRLVGLLRPFTGEVLLSILLGTATVASGIGLLGTSAYLIASAALQPGIAPLQVAIVGVRFFGISRGVFRYLERLVSHSVNFRLLAQLRVWFYQAVEPLVPARLSAYQSGDLLNRAVADVETLQEFYVRLVAPPFVAVLVTLGMGWFAGQVCRHFRLDSGRRDGDCRVDYSCSRLWVHPASWPKGHPAAITTKRAPGRPAARHAGLDRFWSGRTHSGRNRCCRSGVRSHAGTRRQPGLRGKRLRIVGQSCHDVGF